MLQNIFKLNKDQIRSLTLFNDKKCGLLDIVQYKPGTNNKYYVATHVDPGLFSINFLSNSSGLELYSKSKESWTKLPVGYGVIFCGQYAEQCCGIPAVKHRVINNKIGRFTIWYEVGIDKQLEDKKSNKKYSDEKKKVIIRTYDKDIPVRVSTNSNIAHIKNIADRVIGLPTRKSISPNDAVLEQTINEDTKTIDPNNTFNVYDFREGKVRHYKDKFIKPKNKPSSLSIGTSTKFNNLPTYTNTDFNNYW